MNIINTGSKVSGTYHGQSFSGQVREGRPHTMNANWIYFINLDAPISVYGTERTSLCIETGHPAEAVVGV